MRHRKGKIEIGLKPFNPKFKAMIEVSCMFAQDRFKISFSRNPLAPFPDCRTNGFLGAVFYFSYANTSKSMPELALNAVARRSPVRWGRMPLGWRPLSELGKQFVSVRKGRKFDLPPNQIGMIDVAERRWRSNFLSTPIMVKRPGIWPRIGAATL